jgi:hypothetical protein
MQDFAAKVDQLQRLTPALSSCKAHVSTAVPKGEFGANIRRLASKLVNIQVCVGLWRCECVARRWLVRCAHQQQHGPTLTPLPA